VRPTVEQDLLGGFGRQVPVLDQPTQRDRGTACPASLAMNVDRVLLGHVRLHEFDGTLNVSKAGMGKIRRRHSKLLDPH